MDPLKKDSLACTFPVPQCGTTFEFVDEEDGGSSSPQIAGFVVLLPSSHRGRLLQHIIWCSSLFGPEFPMLWKHVERHWFDRGCTKVSCRGNSSSETRRERTAGVQERDRRGPRRSTRRLERKLKPLLPMEWRDLCQSIKTSGWIEFNKQVLQKNLTWLDWI